MIKFDTFDQGKFVIIKYSGLVDKAFLTSFMEFLYQSVNKEMLEKALIDFRDVEIVFDISDFKEILSLRVQYSKGFNHSLRSVYLVQEAKETAFTTKYSMDLPQSISTVFVCSTMAYALRVLDVNLTVDEAEKRIRDLSTVFDH